VKLDENAEVAWHEEIHRRLQEIDSRTHIRVFPGILLCNVASYGRHFRRRLRHADARLQASDGDKAVISAPLSDFGMQGLRTTMLTLLAAVAFVLLIACVNVANLLLARGAMRQKEFAIRRALGAAGSRIARQLLTESVLLALAGGAAGLLLAGWGTRTLFYVFKLNSLYLPLRPVDSIPMDGRVFAFALLVSCLTGVLFGVAPRPKSVLL
jgi:ABC-type antimicrobial peptide transport system permease subunit